MTLEDVRSEIRSQLSSVTAAQLCSSQLQGKVYLAGPPGIKGEPGFKRQPGIKGLSKTSVLPSQRKSGVRAAVKVAGGGRPVDFNSQGVYEMRLAIEDRATMDHERWLDERCPLIVFAAHWAESRKNQT